MRGRHEKIARLTESNCLSINPDTFCRDYFFTLLSVLRPRTAVLTCCMNLVAAASLVAQDTASAPPPSSRAQPLAAVKVQAMGTGYAADRTRSATKTNTPLRDVPQSVTVVTKQIIADQGMQGMADVVRYVPGITMGQGEGHRDAPTIRGQSTTADFFVDGVRDDAQYLRDLYNVERVEALKGANAMVFGRGGGGGVINRVMKEPVWSPVHSVLVEGGSFDHKRTTLDLGDAIGPHGALRVNGLFENSGGFRRASRLERSAVNPEVMLTVGTVGVARLGYEQFVDRRTVDRGIPSFQGRPVAGEVRSFYGDPSASHSYARLDALHARLGLDGPRGMTLRNHTRLAYNDKFYQNVYAGSAVNAAGTLFNLAGYNSTIARRNLFNQTDVTGNAVTGPVQHMLLVGAELGNQSTDNVRNTGYFNGTATSQAASVATPTVESPVTFRQSATDADNHVIAVVAGAYAQDQIALGHHWKGVAGIRVDRFNLRLHNNRIAASPADLVRKDHVLSPRFGLVFTPVAPVSLYATQSVSFLPSGGDQFSALTVTSATLEPERFVNRELGAKWSVLPALDVTAAVYRLDRSKSVAVDPNDQAKVVLTGAQRSTGVEVGATGEVTSSWQIAAGYTAQRARIVSATTSAKAGATAPLVPERTSFLWNKVQVGPRIGLGLGIVHQGDSFASIDNAVVLPAFTRADAALFVAVTDQLRAQLNVENLTNARYYWTSHGNNNIMPGAPRHLLISLRAGR